MANSPKYYYDIDAARSTLMFISVALHAGTVYAPARPWITSNVDRHAFFDWLIFGFHLFITPTFFFIGGFFAVQLLKTRTFKEFMVNRFVRTVIPLLSVAVTLNVVERYLRFVDAGGTDSFLGWVFSDKFIHIWVTHEWQLHLWFLVSLLPMFLITALVHSFLPRNASIRLAVVRIIEKCSDYISNTPGFFIFLLCLAMFNVVNFALVSRVPNAYEILFPGFQPVYKLLAEAPFYVIGVAAALSPKLLEGICKWRLWMFVAAALALLIQPYPNQEHSSHVANLMLFLNQLSIWVIVFFILQFFRKNFNTTNSRTRWFADCALSMYLLHHCFVYIVGRWFVHIDWPIGLEFTILTVAVSSFVLLLHEFIVRRSKLVRLLYNGKTDIEQIQARKAKKLEKALAAKET